MLSASAKSYVSDFPRKVNRMVVPKLLATHFNHTINTDALKHVAVFPEIGIALNRVKKNANSTSITLFRELDTGIAESTSTAKRNTLHLEKIPFHFWLNLRNYNFVTVTRNPYSRVLSAFVNKFQKPAYIDRFGHYPISPEGFRQFVLWLGQGGLAADPHWDLQSKLMLMPVDCYDAVIRFENFSKEMRLFLERKSIAITPHGLNLLGDQNTMHKSYANTRLQEFYTSEVRGRVAEIYRTDFAWLGYSESFPESQTGYVAQ